MYGVFSYVCISKVDERGMALCEHFAFLKDHLKCSPIYIINFDYDVFHTGQL